MTITHARPSVNPSAEKIAQALACGQPGCGCGKRSGRGWITHCPNPDHPDKHPSFTVAEENGRILVKCHADCTQDVVIAALKDRGLWFTPNSMLLITSGNRCNRATGRRNQLKSKEKNGCTPNATVANGATDAGGGSGGGLTLETLAVAKKLPKNFLESLGLVEQRFKGQARVAIPYIHENGEVAAVRYRLSLTGPQRFIWRRGDRILPYGLWKVGEIRRAGWCLLVEGESDCWTAWYHGIPAIGLPGASTWRAEWAETLRELQVFVWAEPDAAGRSLPLKLARDIPSLMVVTPPDGCKDISEAHIRGEDVVALLNRLKAQATPAAVLLQEQRDAHLRELREAAREVLEHPDPLALYEAAVREHYGGDPTPVVVTLLALTSRILAMRPGSMPVHLLLMGQSGTGKSYTLQTALRFMPPEAFHVIDAGSPRVLIYDDADLQHRAVIFSEADSLPAGEDNPAASAMRNLLQDHHLHYKVTERDPDTGRYVVREISRPGPTVLITTATKRLGHQLATRLFALEVVDDPGHICEVLRFQGEREMGQEPPAIDPALVAYQAYLQACAPWDVAVPYAKALAEELGRVAREPRVLRDFSKLISLVKAVAVLRHQHRQRDSQGRVLADLRDYSTVHRLVNRLYAEQVGVTETVRQVVSVVKELENAKEPDITVTKVAHRLNIGKHTAWRRVQAALKGGWLINQETRRGYPAILQTGEPLPEWQGLPHSDYLSTGCTVAQGLHTGCNRQVADIIEQNGTGCTVAPFTGSDTHTHLNLLRGVI